MLLFLLHQSVFRRVRKVRAASHSQSLNKLIRFQYLLCYSVLIYLFHAAIIVHGAEQ